MIDIERIARDSGFTIYSGCSVGITSDLQRFYALVRNEVLEEAAKVADDEADGHRENQSGASDGRYDWKEDSARDCAAAIRALKVKT